MSNVRPKGFAGISHLVTDIGARLHEIKISAQVREEQAQPKFRETATAPKNERKKRDSQRQSNTSAGETLKVYLLLILGLVVIGFVLDSC